jgi:protein YibB
LNPEYWNADYVLVTDLKATFVDMAVRNGLVSNDMVAWIDFGYCRDASKIPASKKWEYNFDPTKIHLFKYHDYQEGRPLHDLVASNDVHILGAKVVAKKEMWSAMAELMDRSFNILMSHKLVDDDQTLFLLSYLQRPDLFELHQIPDHQLGLDPFVLFNGFNDTV